MKLFSKNSKFLNTGAIFKLIMALFFVAAFTACEDDIIDQDPDNNQYPNGDETIEMLILSGTYDDDLHLTNIFDDASKADYLVTGDVVINGALTIEAGVRIELEEDRQLTVSSTGLIQAEGTENSPIIFTSAEIDAGKYWLGLRIVSSDIRNILEHTIVEYAGNSNMKLGPYSSQNRQTNVGVDDDGVLSVINTQISDGKAYGLFVRGSLHEHSNNMYVGNGESALSAHVRNAGVIDEASQYSQNAHNGVEIYGGTLIQEMTWSTLYEDAAFKISGSIEVEAPLFITEGVLMEFDEDVALTVQEGSGGSTIDGYIDVSGTESNPVVFTTSNLAGGQHWKGILIKTSDLRNNMEKVIVEYGGNSNMNIGPYSSQNRQANIGVDSHASLSISNSVVRHSKAWGIAAIENANLELLNIQYENNPEGNLADSI